MADHIEKYRKITEELIKKSYPTLKGKNIKIYEKENLRFSADTFNFLFFMRIRTHPRLRKYNKNKLAGVFAHELCHLEYYNKFHFDIDCFKRLSVKYNERETDKCAIKKGYARQLYEQRKSRYNARDKYANKNRKTYLSHYEIKAYAKSIGKW